MENENLTKQEFQYLKNIEKLEALVEKLEVRLKEKEEEVAKLHHDSETLTLDLKAARQAVDERYAFEVKQAEQVKELEAKNSDLNTQNSALVKTVSELRAKELSDQELLFYYACKADLVVSALLAKGKKAISAEELKEEGFPELLLAKLPTEPLESTNFTVWTKDNVIYLNPRS